MPLLILQGLLIEEPQSLDDWESQLGDLCLIAEDNDRFILEVERRCRLIRELREMDREAKQCLREMKYQDN